MDYGCRWERAEQAHGNMEGDERKEVTEMCDDKTQGAGEEKIRKSKK